MSNTDYAITLSKKNTIFLFIYYILLFIISSFFTTLVLIIHNDSSIISFSINDDNLTLAGCISISILCSSIYYIRKLYKLSLSCSINISDEKYSFKSIGTIFYFYTRPLFSGIFSILLILGIKSGIFILTQSDQETSSSLTEFYMLLSSFSGFSTGKFFNQIEQKSSSLITSLISPS